MIDQSNHSMRSRRASATLRRVAAAALSTALVLQAGGCSTMPSDPGASGAGSQVTGVEDVYGIRVEGLRLTAAGSMLDFRYRVLDAQKAAAILDGKFKPYLLDETRGARLGVPDTPVLGRIRQTSRNNKVLTDHTYFIMFGNPGKALQSGDKVTLLLGQVKITDLTVQ